jgi:hypothetical protein
VAVRWTLLETSLVGIAADAGAAIRGLSNGVAFGVNDVITRMQVRDRIMRRQQMYDAQQAAFGDQND